MEQLAETNRLLALILAELKASNETARKQATAATDSVTIGEHIIRMIRTWALRQAQAGLGGYEVHLD